MGPRLKDVEDPDQRSRRRGRSAGFNGATSQGRGRRIAGGHLRKAHPGFNGATSQGRGRHREHQHGRTGPGASMGPRLKDVEDVACRKGRQNTSCGFNGATSQGRGRQERKPRSQQGHQMLQWGHVSRTWKTRRWEASPTPWPAGFNGATSQGRGRLVALVTPS